MQEEKKQTKKNQLFDCAAVVANLKLCCLPTLTDWISVAWQPLPTKPVLTPTSEIPLEQPSVG